MSENPYAAPQAHQERKVEGESPPDIVLASRLRRLGARIIDGIVIIIVTVFLALLIPSYGTSFEDAMEQAAAEMAASGDLGYFWTYWFFTGISTAAVIEWLVGVAIVLALNGYLLAQYGQSIGKLAVSIKIVKVNTYEKPTLTTSFGIREVGMMLLNWFPILGLIDILFIFGPAKRCVHDYWSDTIVVEAN